MGLRPSLAECLRRNLFSEKKMSDRELLVQQKTMVTYVSLHMSTLHTNTRFTSLYTELFSPSLKRWKVNTRKLRQKRRRKESPCKQQAHTCWAVPFPLHGRAHVLDISIIATIKLPIKMDRSLRTWEPAGCLSRGFPHIWFSLLDKYTASYWMSHLRVSPHFIGLLCHYSHSTSCFSKVEAGSLTADRCFFQLKDCLKEFL